jgi:hypothetical protein
MTSHERPIYADLTSIFSPIETIPLGFGSAGNSVELGGFSMVEWWSPVSLSGHVLRLLLEC